MPTKPEGERTDIKVCDLCHRADFSANIRRDPYAWDVNGEEVMMRICDDCYEQRCDDI
jgi:hypothetical protein